MAFRTAPFVTIAASLLIAISAGAEPAELTFAQAQSRTGADAVLVHAGESIVVRGTVASPPVWALDGYLLAVRDQSEYGFVLHGSLADFASLTPGDDIEASGTVMNRRGMAVLTSFRIGKRGRSTAPEPREVLLSDLHRIRYLGLMVKTGGEIVEIRPEEAGDSLILADERDRVKLFIPKMRGDVIMDTLAPFRVGDIVQVRGLAVQECVLPPYNRSFQIIAFEPNPVTLVDRPAKTAKAIVLGAILLAVLTVCLWYWRTHRLARRRKAVRALHALGEEILAAGTRTAIVNTLAEAVPGITGATLVRVYEYSRRTRTLDRIPSAQDPDPLSIHPESPNGPIGTGAAVAFRSRSILHLPDLRRSAQLKRGLQPELPRSVIFIPMLAQEEVRGVLELGHTAGIRTFTQDEQVSAQHLANQVAAALRLHEQRSVREQLFRSEKLAATAQLISGIAAELRAPLEGVLAASNRLLGRIVESKAERDIRAVFAEAQRAWEIVARLISIGRADQTTPQELDLNHLIGQVVRLREHEWRARGIRIKQQLWSSPLRVMAVSGHLEQALLSVLVHGEHCVAEQPDKSITIATLSMGDRAVVEFSYLCPEAATDPFASRAATEPAGFGLDVVRGIVHSLGGETRFSRHGRMCRLEFDFPACAMEAPAHPDGSAIRTGRTLTTLLIDSDTTEQRWLVGELAVRNHRVVPLARAEEALDLVHRMRFDVVVCSARLNGFNWVDFVERSREQVGAYLLLGAGSGAAHLEIGAASLFVVENVTDRAAFERALEQAESAAETPAAMQAGA
jgi:C4-dicarboxylate-specific signal transduction histidine kinase